MTEHRDRHAEERERRQRKERYGMRVSGRSVRLLAQLGVKGQKKKRRRKKKSSR